MHSWILFKKYLVFIGVATVFSFFTIVILLPDEAVVSPVESTPSVKRTVSNAGLPVYLKIPSINVAVAVGQAGVAPDGSMDAPKNPDSVAWFNLGPRPGERGSAVIAGHYGWKDNIPAVFDSISSLKKGDALFVEDTTGTTTMFVVRESRLYDPNADASSVFSSNDGKVHLNLVTCNGIWNKTAKSYSNRLVVFADKI